MTALGTEADDRDGPWPDWARPQLRHAVGLAAGLAERGDRIALAPELYRSWFNPPVASDSEFTGPRRPLAGVCRSAHAGSGIRVLRDGLATVARQDAIGRDGWWRTWGEQWRPRQDRETSVRLMLTPRPERLGDLVRELTAALLTERFGWLVACATDPRRLRRVGGCAVLLPHVDALPAGLLDRIVPLLRPVAPPLCLPLAPGVGLADTPDNGMSFGELRCHLVALGLAGAAGRRPLAAIAEAFATHGVDPGMPWRSRPVLRTADQPDRLRR